MYYTIYKITNTINSKIYIGKHQTNNPEDSYYGSGIGIVSAIKKYGKEHFKKEILYIFDAEEEMNSKEKELITEEFVSRRDTYNAGIGGEGGPHFKGKKHSAKTKALLKEKRANYPAATIKTRRKISESNRRRTVSDETKAKIGAASKGRTITDETRAKMSAASKRRTHTDETKRKISEKAKERELKKKLAREGETIYSLVS